MLALALGCEQTPRYTARSSTIVLARGGASVWVTSPDDDTVVEIDAATLEVRRAIAIEGAPAELAWVGDRLLVTLAQSSDLAVIDVTASSVRRVTTPCGGTRAVVATEGGGAIVSCPNDDLVLGLSAELDAIAWSLASPGRPTALAVIDDRFAVSASRLGRVRVYSNDRVLIEEIVLSETPGLAAVQVDSLAGDARGFHAIYQRVDHDSDRARPPERGGYGSVIDGAPRIEPRLESACGTRYARFDGGARVFSGPSAIALGGGLVWALHRSTDDVAVLRCDGGDPIGRVATFEVGRGPRGIALAEDGRTAWIDVGFTRSVARLELGALPSEAEGPVLDATLERTRPLGPTPRLSEEARRGRALFFDADDTHLTPSGVVTCGTCHPDGGDDGLTWFFHTGGIAPKVRRTPAAWGARPSLAPFHWDGELADAPTLATATIRELMEGDALLVDVDAIAAWMAEAEAPPGRPVDASRGRALFESPEVGCASCHSGEHLSDARAHSVLAPSTDPLAQIELVDTPSLHGVRARPPFLHDGRAATLLDVLTVHNAGDLHGHTSHLSPSDLDALVTYLETL